MTSEAFIKGRSLHLVRTRAVVLLLFWLTSVSPAQTKNLTLEDILSFDQVIDVELSPDGNQILYITTRPGSNDAYGVYGEYQTLHLLSVATREVRVLTNTGFRSPDGDRATRPREEEILPINKGVRMPRWSPNGCTVAFLSGHSGSSQVWLVDLNTGEPRQLTGRSSQSGESQASVAEFAFSPDGQSIAYRRILPPKDEPGASKLKTIVVSGASSALRANNSQRSIIEVVEIASGKLDRLTEALSYGLLPFPSLRWSCDGSQLLFVRDPTSLLDASQADIVILTVKDRKVSAPALTPAIEYNPDFSPDGGEVAFLATVKTSSSDPIGAVWYGVRSVEIMDTKTGAIRRISGDYTNEWFLLPLLWHKATNTIYFGGRDKATTRIFALSPKGGTPRRVTPDGFHVRDYSLSEDGKRMAAILENANTPPETYVGNLETGVFTCLTKLNPQLNNIRLGHVDQIEWRSKDNRFTVEGFLVKPPDYKPGKRYPLLVNLHGGPTALFENGYRDVNFICSWHTPAQLYAMSGYLVLLPNHRGDESYGSEFARALRENWGRGDVNNDTEAGVDYLINQGLADPDRLGIMGFSYGAYAAAWAITQTNRYKAASINDGPINLISYYSQAYLTNHEFMEYYFGGNPSDRKALYVDRSPITWASKINTPVLLRFPVGHGSIRPERVVGLAQGLELYRALHERGVPTELLIHPDEIHVIRDLDVYRDYVDRNLQWFNYWVLGKGRNPLESAGK